MKLLSRRTACAIIAICAMAKDNRRLYSSNELSKKLDIPLPFLRGILQKLNKEKVLDSYQGKDGGFKLAAPSHKICLIDVIAILQGPIQLNNCIIRKKECPKIKSCFLKKKIDKIEDSVKRELGSITIKSILD